MIDREQQVARRFPEPAIAITARIPANVPAAEPATLRHALKTISARLDQQPA